MANPLACPFCSAGPDRLHVRTIDAEDFPSNSVAVCCGRCGAEGPPFRSRLKAVRAWNRACGSKSAKACRAPKAHP